MLSWPYSSVDQPSCSCLMLSLPLKITNCVSISSRISSSPPILLTPKSHSDPCFVGAEKREAWFCGGVELGLRNWGARPLPWSLPEPLSIKRFRGRLEIWVGCPRFTHPTLTDPTLCTRCSTQGWGLSSKPTMHRHFLTAVLH